MRRAYFKNNWIAALVVAPQSRTICVLLLARQPGGVLGLYP